MLLVIIELLLSLHFLVISIGVTIAVVAAAAKKLPDNISEEVKVARLQRMIELQNELSAESNRRDIGKRFEVLVEGFSKRSREQLCGRTPQNKTVVFDKENYHIGDRVMVEIYDSSSATLLGKPI